MTNNILPKQQKNYIFNHSEIAISAVRNNMGIGIGRKSLISDYLDSGELVAPFEVIQSNLSYHLICPKVKNHDRDIKPLLAG